MTTFRDIPEDEYFHYICIGRHKDSGVLWGFVYSNFYRGNNINFDMDSDSYSIVSIDKFYPPFEGTDIEKDHIEIYAEKRKCAERMEEIVRESINTTGCDIYALRQAIRMIEYTKEKK